MKYNLFILLPNLSDEEVKVMQAQIKEIIKKVDGKIENIEEIGKRKLSYAVKKVRQGFYADYILSLDKNKVNELKKELKLNQGILRFELSHTNQHKYEHKSTQKLKKGKLKKDKVGTPARPAGGEQRSVCQEEKKKEKKERPKISMEELDEKLDNILQTKDI